MHFPCLYFDLQVPLEKLSVKIEELQEARTSQLVKVKYAEKEKDSAEQPVIELMAEIRTDNAIVLAKNQLYSVDELDYIFQFLIPYFYFW